MSSLAVQFPSLSNLSVPSLSVPNRLKLTEDVAVDLYLGAHRTIRSREFLEGPFKRAYLEAEENNDPKFNKFNFGMIRPPDPLIVAEIISRLVAAKGKKMRVLEIGCGPSTGYTYSVGSPWLSRCLSVAFPHKLEMHVNDLHTWIRPEIESRVFGMDVHRGNIRNMDLFNFKFDVIFCRYQAPHGIFYDAASELKEIRARKKGCVIIHEDGGDVHFEGKKLSKSFNPENLERIRNASPVDEGGYNPKDTARSVQELFGIS